MPIRVAIVEDQLEVRQGLAYMIDGSAGFSCVGAYGDAESALEDLASREIDIVLMDIGLPGISGIQALPRLKLLQPDAQIMMLTIYDDDAKIFQSLQAGATGYILKKTPPAQLIDNIQTLYRGGSPMSSQIARRVVETFHVDIRPMDDDADLTPREQEILELLVQGYRYREIVDRLNISLDTVRTHIRHIYEKMQVRSRGEATYKYLKGGGER